MRIHLPTTITSKHFFWGVAVATATIAVILISTFALYFQRTSALKHMAAVEDSGSVGQLTEIIKTPPPASPTPALAQPPQRYEIPQQTHVYQTFNNCGPASLSMLLPYQGVTVNQKELGDILRPRQHPQGVDDDKSVTISELAQEAENRGLKAYHRPGATTELIKQLVEHDFPVLVRTWLSASEDIGHYRIIRGYDDTTQEFIQDDSLQGENLGYSYDEFVSLWQPFQYEFLVIATPEKADMVESILGELADTTRAWQGYQQRAIQESQQEQANIYPLFNQSIAAYHLGDYQRAVSLYEQAAPQLPRRMLWYQIQPIDAYLQLGEYQRVFELTDSIINDQNKAFSELYLLRGQAFERLGDREAARREYELAVLYNQNLKVARQLLNGL